MTTKLSPEPIQTAELVECVFCQRRFAANRIEIHENICKKFLEAAKKPCNTSKRCPKEETSEKSKEAKEDTGTVKNLLSTNWRQQHEQLLQQIKAEKRNDREKRKHEFLRVLKGD